MTLFLSMRRWTDHNTYGIYVMWFIWEGSSFVYFQWLHLSNKQTVPWLSDARLVDKWCISHNHVHELEAAHHHCRETLSSFPGSPHYPGNEARETQERWRAVMLYMKHSETHSQALPAILKGNSFPGSPHYLERKLIPRLFPLSWEWGYGNSRKVTRCHERLTKPFPYALREAQWTCIH